MRPEEQVSRKGGELWLSETELHGKQEPIRQVYNWVGRGGMVVDFERVNVSHLGASWDMLPRKILILSPPKWLEMHLKLTWWGETYILSTDKRSRHKKIFFTKSCVALIGVLISLKQHKELGPACQSWREFSYPPTVKITIQIQHFAETYGKQTLKGILLNNEKMSCRHTKSPFYTLRKLKDVFKSHNGSSWRFVERMSHACDLFYGTSLHNQ